MNLHSSQSTIAFPRDLASALHARMSSGLVRTIARIEAEPDSSVARSAFTEMSRPLPSLQDLAYLLDTAYVASLLEEEGRRVGCAFGYASPETAQSLGFTCFRFSSHVPLTPATLSKLAPAAQAGRTELGVWSARGHLVVWGFIHHGDQRFAIDVEHRPTYFSARILRPGAFTVQFDERLQLLFSRDHGHFFDETFDLLGTMRDRDNVDPLVANALCRVAQRMLSHGHGGTLLVVSKDAPVRGIVEHPAFGQAGRPDMMLAEAMKLHEYTPTRSKDESEGVYVHRRQRLEKAHDEALDFVARLTAVDGAVVLDSELGLLGAGATIQTPADGMPDEVVSEDPRRMGIQTHEPLAAIGGNRHRSAVGFCAQQTAPALAIVASQDGDVSYMSRGSDGTVHVLRPYELGVGI